MQNQPPTSQIILSDFAQLVASMSQALFGLTTIPIFGQQDVSLAHWVALSALSQNEGISNKQLASKLGVTGQRVNQITTELSRSGLISISVSPKDSRMHELGVTPEGWRVLDAINQKLEPLVTTTFAGRERLLVRTNNSIRLLLKLVKSAKTPAETVRGL
jgi:DNA-binding MarR family transcriptional regulator